MVLREVAVIVTLAPSMFSAPFPSSSGPTRLLIERPDLTMRPGSTLTLGGPASGAGYYGLGA